MHAADMPASISTEATPSADAACFMSCTFPSLTTGMAACPSVVQGVADLSAVMCRFAAKPGTASYVAMDTNGDGVVDNLDDPYEPYYPGDTSVDWVGMSVRTELHLSCALVPGLRFSPT